VECGTFREAERAAFYHALDKRGPVKITYRGEVVYKISTHANS